jgi:hypothetical protein
MAALRSGHDSVMNFTNTAVTFGVDPLRSRLDLWLGVEHGGRLLATSKSKFFLGTERARLGDAEDMVGRLPTPVPWKESHVERGPRRRTFGVHFTAAIARLARSNVSACRFSWV